MGRETPVNVNLSPFHLHTLIGWIYCIIYLHSRGLAGSIVPEERGDLSFIEPQGQSINGQFVSMAVDLHKVLNVNTWVNVARFLLNTHSCGSNKGKDKSIKKERQR